MTPCPGCGAALSGPGTPRPAGRLLASPECLGLADEVLGYELEHVVELGDLHQLRIDAYAAQHAGPETKPITTFFALSGLYLHLERGSGNEDVRTAHGIMANSGATFPRFPRPERLGTRTVVDVARATSPAEWRDALEAWAADVWGAWPEDVRRVVADETVRLVPARWFRRTPRAPA